MLHLQEGRVDILGAVAEEIERGHQQHGVDGEPPVRFHDRQRTAALDRRLLARSSAIPARCGGYTAPAAPGSRRP